MKSLLFKNATLRNRKGLFSLLIENGKFSRIAPSESFEHTDGIPVIDVSGNMVTPPLVDPHVHLDAVLSSEQLSRQNVSGTLLEAIDIWGERKGQLTKELIKKNAKEVLRWYIANGVLRVRTHGDCSEPSLLTIEGLLEVREEMKDVIDIQVVAFPQDGIFTSREGKDLLIRAMEMGADVVGGAPHIEFTREDGVEDVKTVYEIAERFHKLIDIHIDETGDPQSRFVEVMAKESIIRGWQGRATASHTTAMHNYNNDYAFKLIGNLKRGGIHMITNPFDNSVLQNRTDGYPRKRGHTRVDELLARGVNVAIGHDSIMDPWYSMGKGSMLQAAHLLLHTAHLCGAGQIPILMDMITINSAKLMNIEDSYGIEEGKQADFVVFDGRNETEILRLTSECLYVVRKGNMICETKPAVRKITIDGEEELVTWKL